jgi:LPXTG-motif cell wall-anchored protein
VNNTGTVLPETGAEGTFFLITGGTMLVILAAVFMITRKKMSIYED